MYLLGFGRKGYDVKYWIDVVGLRVVAIPAGYFSASFVLLFEAPLIN